MSVLFFSGLIRSLEFTAINAVSYAELKSEVMSRATSFASMAQQLSLSAGVATSALILHLVSPGGQVDAGDISIAFVGVGCLSTIGALLFVSLPTTTGGDMIRRDTGSGRGGHAPEATPSE
jgi:hypothetical protein